MNSPITLHKKDTRSFTEKYFFEILIFSAIFTIILLFVLAWAIVPQSPYIALGGI